MSGSVAKRLADPRQADEAHSVQSFIGLASEVARDSARRLRADAVIARGTARRRSAALRSPDAVDVPQRVDRRRLQPRHLAQRGVVEDDVRRHAARAGDLEAHARSRSNSSRSTPSHDSASTPRRAWRRGPSSAAAAAPAPGRAARSASFSSATPVLGQLQHRKLRSVWRSSPCRSAARCSRAFPARSSP